MYLLNLQNILWSLCLTFITALLCLFGFLWLAPIFPVITFYVIIARHFGDPKEYAFLDTKGMMKVFDTNVLLAFALFYFIPIYIPCAIITWDSFSEDGILWAALYKLAYIYDDFYNYFGSNRYYLTKHGYYNVPVVFPSLRTFEGNNSTFFPINFFAFAMLNVISGIMAWIVGTLFALNQKWPRSFVAYRLSDKEASRKFWINFYIVLSFGLYFVLKGILFSPTFDKAVISIKLLGLNAFGFMIPVYLRGLLSKS